MKKMLLSLFSVCALVVIEAQDQIPAFPGAEGWGMYAKGGRGGEVLFVTNLNDNGPGSFRDAVTQFGPRIVVFQVSGTIELESELIISNPYLTIAGQTAPGDGICLKNYTLNIHNTHDIVIRNIRVRPGPDSGLPGSDIDALEIRHSKDVIIDHCSFSWSVDEGINNWHGSENTTIQWSIMSEALHNSVHYKGGHSYGASIGALKTSFHHNILAHNHGRNPSIAGNTEYFTLLFDYRNCVVYNWVNRTCDGKPLSINVVNNYLKPGPATRDNVARRIARIDNSTHMGFAGQWHVEGNVVEGFPEISSDNWNGGVDFHPGTSPERNRQLNPFDVAPVTTHTAHEAYELVLKYAGVISPGRDAHDKRIVSEIKDGTYQFGNKGIIDHPDEVGGWPELKSLPVPLDSDGDGIPDEWEIAHGLDPFNPDDANEDRNGDGYTNIEEYINSLVPAPYRIVNY